MDKFSLDRIKLTNALVTQVRLGTHNTFVNIVEAVYGKEKADELRKLGIEAGKWIEMDGVVYNGS